MLQLKLGGCNDGSDQKDSEIKISQSDPAIEPRLKASTTGTQVVAIKVIKMTCLLVVNQPIQTREYSPPCVLFFSLSLIFESMGYLHSKKGLSCY